MPDFRDRAKPRAAAGFAALAALYLALAGGVAPAEVLTAFAAAGGAMYLRRHLLDPAPVPLRLRRIARRWLVTLRDLTFETVIVLRVLLCARRGAMPTGDFVDYPIPEDYVPSDLVALSVPPNSYVVEHSGDRLLVHHFATPRRSFG